MNEQGNEGINIETDFNLADEYKPDPLAPQGKYIGGIVSVSWDQAAQAIVWKVTLRDNGGTMTDGETEIDGQTFYYRNWLPRPGDESIMTASGRNNKRQAKINMMTDFAEGMEIDMSTPKAIIAAIENGEWVGIDVLVTLSIEEYQGRTRNNISRMALFVPAE